MKPASAKQKGRNGQKAIRDAILSVFPELESDDVRSTPMGAPGEDIMLSPAARRILPYQIESKAKAASQIHTYMKQAASHGPHEPLVIVKMDRDKTLAVVELSHFLSLIRELYDLRLRNLG